MVAPPPRNQDVARLAHRLTWAGIIVLPVVPLVVAALIALRGAGAAQARVEEERRALAQATALTAAGFVDAQLSAIGRLAHSPDFTDFGSRPDPRGLLAQALAETPDWESIELFQADGWSVIGAGQDIGPLNIADRAYFQQVLASGRPAIGPARPADDARAAAVPVAQPIAFTNGASGVIIVWVSTHRLDRAVTAIRGPSGAQVALLDREGTTFVRAEPDASSTIPARAPAGSGAELDGPRVVRSDDGDGRETLAALAPVGDTGWRAVVSQPASQAFAPIRDQLRDQLLLLGLATAGLVALALYLSRRLARSYAAEIEAMRRVDAFVASASHDLKTPLTVVRTLAQLMRRRLGSAELPDTQWFGESLTTMDEAVVKMSAQIDELLDSARMGRAHRLELHLRDIDLIRLVQRVARDQQRTTTRHEIRVETALRELRGRFDPERLERVLANLIGNAIKYSPTGGPIVIAITRERLAPPGRRADSIVVQEWAVIAVRDQGVGIPRADLARVFDQFHRAANVAGQMPGSGIGLAGARQIVEQHGGALAVESVEGEGSTFTLRLPLGTQRQQPHSTAA